jgi:hypothetical protein
MAYLVETMGVNKVSGIVNIILLRQSRFSPFLASGDYGCQISSSQLIQFEDLVKVVDELFGH